MVERRSGEEKRHLSERAYHLNPGYVYFSSDNTAIRTVVGNSVAVCLWDKRLQQGGMNHFMYPSTKDVDRSTPKYGNVATVALLRTMQQAGSQEKDLVAQIVGGAAYEKSIREIGKKNISVARRMLKKFEIPIISEDVGGEMGRKVIFDLESGHLLVVKVHQIRKSDWVKDFPEEY